MITKSKGQIKNWLNSPPEPKKEPLPHSPSFVRVPQVKVSSNRTLVLCLGDNIVPVLKAIKTHHEAHKTQKVLVFYDETSQRIRDLLEPLRQYCSKRFIEFKQAGTDHMGASILEKMKQYLKPLSRESVYINITPGTKAQAVALATGACKLDIKDRLYSIHKNRLVEITTGSSVAEVSEVPPEEVIPFYFYEHRTKRAYEQIARTSELWESLLDVLSKNPKAYRGGGFSGIYYKGQRFLDVDEKALKVYHRGLHREFKLPREVFQRQEDIRGGFWWEVVVYWALRRHLQCEVHLNVEHLDERQLPLSELDIVTAWEKNIIVVSCKTSTKELDLHSMQLVAEARARFARMAVCFIAVPTETERQLIELPHQETFVRVLPPTILNNRQRLLGELKDHIKRHQKSP
ncbi:MAG: hypothetical protein D6778_09215 [Nitrospirae bacterium]|nr:MAG: hypothetical protein D6778_09215 [Nitrospirota bacterium]